MADQGNLGGAFTLLEGGVTLNRMGYGAMQLAGPHVLGPPRDEGEAIAVLREAVAQGVDHIDTADFYGPHVTNHLIRRALYPYPNELTIVTKIGYRRSEDGAWIPAFTAEALVASVHDNLRHLGLDALDVVNLRMGGPSAASEPPLEEPLATLVDLQRQGLVRHIGLSNVTQEQFERGAAMAKIVCVQNMYNVARRDDDALIDALAERGVAYVPYFPLGGFTPLQSGALSAVAERLEVTPMQVALAWLLHRAPNILLIPGTSSVAHLRENLHAASLQLPADALAELSVIGAAKG